MAFNALALFSGWQRSNARSKAMIQVLTKGGDAPSDSPLQSDLSGVAWVEATAEAPISGNVALVVGAGPVAAGRQLLINTSAAGTAAVTFLDGSSVTITVPVGLTILPWAVTGISAATATATYASLK